MNTIDLVISPLICASEALATAYRNEFAENPLQDEVWQDVHRISLHSLTTGVLILEPAETKYCIIPPESLEKLRRAANGNNPDELAIFATTIMRHLRENPKAFRPQFKVVLLNGPLDDYRFYWKEKLQEYTLGEDGVPTSPRLIYDLVFRELKPHGIVAQVLVASDKPEHATSIATHFLQQAVESTEKYRERIHEVFQDISLDPAGENGTQVNFEAPKVWSFKLAVINDPRFKRYVQEVHIDSPSANRFGAKVLEQLIQTGLKPHTQNSL